MSEDAAGRHVVGTARVKRGLAEMLRGGVIMDVVTPDQARVAEDAGAVAAMGGRTAVRSSKVTTALTGAHNGQPTVG